MTIETGKLYDITSQVATNPDGSRCVVINQGGDTQIGYGIWSREDLMRLIEKLKADGDVVWGR